MLVGIAFASLLWVSGNVAVNTNCGTIWLTVSSLREYVGNKADDKLEINWNITCQFDPEPPNIIRVFDGDPAEDRVLEPMLTLIIQDYPEGYYRSNITVDRLPLPGGWNSTGGAALPGSHCFKHHAALYKNNFIVSSSCLQIWPTWMDDLRRHLGRLPISALMIPGTHDSGSYESGDLELTKGLRRYLLAQDCNVWTQLVHGIRYLDIRVGYYPSIFDFMIDSSEIDYTDRFWANHDIIRINPLSDVIKNVRNFLDAARGEVVIMDFHKFPVHFKPNIHRHLVSLLHRSFGNLIVERDHGVDGLGPTLNDLWNRGKRLIICYGDNNTVAEYDWLWPPMTQEWGNKQSPQDLLEYLNETLMGDQKPRNSQNPLWAVMAELTPRKSHIILGLPGGLRQMADSVNRNLSALFQNEWWKRTNIVATDFFLGNNLIDVSIQANIEKSSSTQWRP